jgi:hypothetical protein
MKLHCLWVALISVTAINCADRPPRPSPENDPANPGAQEAKAAPASSALTMEPSFPPPASAAAPPMQEPMNMPMQEPMKMPMQGPMKKPMQGPMKKPMQGPMKMPMQEPMKMPMQEPMNMHGSMKMQHHPAVSGAADGGAP